MVLIEIDATRRSGHHAFTQWLISNIHEWEYKDNLCKFKYNHILGNKNIIWVNEGERDVDSIKSYISERIHNHQIVIITYETVVSSRLDSNYTLLTDELREKWNVEEHIQIPYVRDIYNNLASWSKMANPALDKNEFQIYLQIYKNQLRKVINNFRGVIYDKWIADEKYANEVCLKLIGKPNKFNPLDIGGTVSSFNDEAKIESLLNRYKSIEIPKKFTSQITQDKELVGMMRMVGMNNPSTIKNE